MNVVGILYHPKVQKTEDFAHTVEDFLKNMGIQCWLHSSWDELGAKKLVNGSDLIISIGGDGTILRVARIIFPGEIPIVGINFGNLGFLAELEAGEALTKLTDILKGQGWVEERNMLKAKVNLSNIDYHALNDVVVGRGKNMRLVNIQVSIDNAIFTTYRADAVIISTATGSTSYSLAANGPILYPGSRDLMLKAVCPHLSMDKALILPPVTKIKLKVLTNHEAVISMDGQIEEQLCNGDEVTVSLSSHVTRFACLKPSSNFYTTLVSKLRGTSI